jgi:hypothetical protein
MLYSARSINERQTYNLVESAVSVRIAKTTWLRNSCEGSTKAMLGFDPDFGIKLPQRPSRTEILPDFKEGQENNLTR